MRSKRTPDRVHVVRTPEQSNNKTAVSSNNESREIALMLAQISNKLKRSETERYKLLTELRDYRETLDHLKDKAENSEKAYQELEARLGNNGVTSERQSKFEKTLKATEEKMVKAIAGQALIDKRLQDTEEKQMMIDQQIEKSVENQKKIEHQIEMNIQDKSRLLRKMERLEEMMTDTQDTLRAKAMVLLTDKSSASKVQLQAPAFGEGSPQIEGHHFMAEPVAPWKRYINMQTVGLVSMVIAALLAGWAISQIQKIAPSSNQESTNQTITSNEADMAPIFTSVDTLRDQNNVNADFVEDAAAVQSLPENVIDYSDDQLLEALSSDPEGLAEQLNAIEPESATEEAPVEVQNLEKEPVSEVIPLNDTKSEFPDLNMTVTDPLDNFDQVAFKQDKDIETQINEIVKSSPPLSEFTRDTALPAQVQKIEAAAFAGNAEAQHDIGAIYVAGPGGIEQNFEKANFWFLKAAQKNIPNAIYNLGVLNHQGLGVEQDLDKALYWYREAAKRGHSEAQYNLGISHIEGIGTDYDPALAAGFFERAANNGIVEAAYNLGLIYENGLLGNVKLEEALLWYNIAAVQGNLEAQKAMEQIAQKLQIGTEDIGKFVDRMQAINLSVKGKRAGPDLTNIPSSRLESSKAITAQIQEYLALSGQYNGPSDGINGPKTENAIKKYQAENNMAVTGAPSKVLLNHMVNNTLANAAN